MKVPKFKSIRFRLTLWYALILSFTFVASGVLLYQGFKMSLLDTIDANLRAAAQEVESNISGVPFRKWKENIKRVERGFVVNRLFIQLLEFPGEKDENLQLIIRSGILAGNIPLKKLWELILHQIPETPLYMNVNINRQSAAAHPMRIILYPLNTGTEKKYLIQVGISLKKMFNTLKYFLGILVLSIPMLLLLSIFGGYLILSKALLPVKAAVRTARSITAEDLSLRIESKNRKDEIGLLITTFNQMISRLERSVSQLKQFSSDASHDLKTPLTIIRGEIDIALRKQREPQEYIKTLNTVQEEAQRLERIIDNLLFLSRIDDREYNSHFQPISLDEILLQSYEIAQQLANKKGITFLIQRMEEVFIMGDSILLNRLIMNILDNAIKYTPPGGRVEIFLDRDKNQCHFIVNDTGIGISEESLPFIFDRFYCVDQSRSKRSEGSGLGLSIVKKIAEVHKAEINISSMLNEGTSVKVSFAIHTSDENERENDAAN